MQKNHHHKIKINRFWKGKTIDNLAGNEVFVFGSNPEARHFAGAAKAALKFGAIACTHHSSGVARGLSPNQKTYALITKNLTKGVMENGIIYEKEGYRSVSKKQIKENIAELYKIAKELPQKDFLITYQYEVYDNGKPKKSLNGYSSDEMFEMFTEQENIPDNIIFHESYEPYLKKIYDLSIKSSKEIVISKSSIANETLSVSHICHQDHPCFFQYKGFDFFSISHFLAFSKAKTFSSHLEIEKLCLNVLSSKSDSDFLKKKHIEMVNQIKSGELDAVKILNDDQLLNIWREITLFIKNIEKNIQDRENIWHNKYPSVLMFGFKEKFLQNPGVLNEFKEYWKNTDLAKKQNIFSKNIDKEVFNHLYAKVFCGMEIKMKT